MEPPAVHRGSAAPTARSAASPSAAESADPPLLAAVLPDRCRQAESAPVPLAARPRSAALDNKASQHRRAAKMV